MTMTILHGETIGVTGMPCAERLHQQRAVYRLAQVL
jgi:hypothetical protein